MSRPYCWITGHGGRPELTCVLLSKSSLLLVEQETKEREEAGGGEPVCRVVEGREGFLLDDCASDGGPPFPSPAECQGPCPGGHLLSGSLLPLGKGSWRGSDERRGPPGSGFIQLLLPRSCPHSHRPDPDL